MRRPNIIMFFTDQQRWDTCGCYNPELDLTPNLDTMAGEGVRFEKAYTCQPVCGPARASLQTGLYPTETGCYRNGMRLKPVWNTLANYLNDAGYETGYTGKWHLADVNDGPVKKECRGGYKDYWKVADILEFSSMPYYGCVFDENNERVYFEGRYRVDFITDLSIDYLKTRTGEKPFFLFQSLIEPHHQNIMGRYVAPDGYAERYKDAWVPGDLACRKGQGNWEKQLPDYYGQIKSIDENLGRIIETLRQTGQLDNTVIIFTSDHGSHFMTRNSEYKRSCHDACSRIPMVIAGPGFEGGRVVTDRMASLIDIPSTILDIAGIEVPPYMQGRSLVGALKDGEPWREEIFMQISESQVGRAVCDGRYKYSVFAPEKNGWEDSWSDVYAEQFLYDLEKDPDENNNLVSDPAYTAERARLAKSLVRQVEAVERRTPKIVPAG